MKNYYCGSFDPNRSQIRQEVVRSCNVTNISLCLQHILDSLGFAVLPVIKPNPRNPPNTSSSASVDVNSVHTKLIADISNTKPDKHTLG